jgi:hypothetical protein
MITTCKFKEKEKENVIQIHPLRYDKGNQGN